MSGSGRFIILKFVPDRVRFEPVNVAVVLELEGRIVTRVADEVDPRIRLADPFLDQDSYDEMLGRLATLAPEQTAADELDRLAASPGPNLFASSPSEFVAEPGEVDALADRFFGRYVQRRYVKPYVARSGPRSAATRSAIRDAFASAGVQSYVQASVRQQGKSGVDWNIDFRYLTDEVTVIQSATTSLKEPVRNAEHGYRAFSALVDVSLVPGVRGVLALDASPEESELSSQLEQLAIAHGLGFYAGQRQFFELAQDVQRRAQPLSSSIVDSLQQVWST